MSNIRLWEADWDRAFTVGGRLVDPAARQIERGGVAVDVEPRVMAVLVALAQRPGSTVRRQELIDLVWDGAAGADQSLNNAVSLLRSALGDGDASRRIVQTIPKQGYRLCAPVTRERPPQPGAAPFDARTTQAHARPPLARHPIVLAAAALALIAVGGYGLGDRPPRAAAGAGVEGVQSADRASIAVLPFVNLTGDPGDDYVAVGLAEEILNALAQVGALSVAAQTDSFQARDEGASIAEIGARLGVDNVLEGSVRRDGERWRVTAQLIAAADSRHVWSATFDGEAESILTIQRDIGLAIAEALTDQIGAEERRRLIALPTENIEAYESYLLANYDMRQMSAASYARAIAHYERAVALDPDFAEAHVAVGWAYYFAGTHYGWMPPDEAVSRVRAAIAHGVAASDPLVRAQALALYGDVLTWRDHDWAGAREAFERAYDLNPEPAAGHALLLSIIAEHDRAIALWTERRALGFDTKNERSNLAWAYFNAGRYAEAAAEARAALALDDRFADAYRVLGRAQLLQGETDAAVRSFERAAVLLDRAPTALSDLAVALARAGREAEARALLAELEALVAEAYVPAPLIAQVHANLGDADAAFAWLERGIEDGARGVVFLKVNPLFDPLRDDPRLPQLLAALSLAS